MNKSSRLGPKSAEEFREQCDDLAGRNLFALHRLAGWAADGSAPYRYDGETLKAIELQARKILELLRVGRILQHGEPIDPARMDQVRAAEGDADFQKFLGQLRQDGPAKGQP